MKSMNRCLFFKRAFRGRPVTLLIRANTGQNRQTEDSEYSCHSNDTWGHIRRMIHSRYISFSLN